MSSPWCMWYVSTYCPRVEGTVTGKVCNAQHRTVILPHASSHCCWIHRWVQWADWVHIKHSVKILLCSLLLSKSAELRSVKLWSFCKERDWRWHAEPSHPVGISPLGALSFFCFFPSSIQLFFSSVFVGVWFQVVFCLLFKYISKSSLQRFCSVGRLSSAFLRDGVGQWENSHTWKCFDF